VSCCNEQFGTGKTIERLPRQSDLCGRIAHLDREETQNVLRQHRSVFAAWIALFHFPRLEPPELFDSLCERAKTYNSRFEYVLANNGPGYLYTPDQIQPEDSDT
jgi:hypothetical protein